MNRFTTIALFIIVLAFTGCKKPKQTSNDLTSKVDALLEQMTLDEKIGQLVQKNTGLSDSLVRAGGVGSVLNEVNVDEVNRLQKIAIEESRLGIPLVFARDVIHGFHTILPIPIGLASSWNPELVKEGAHISALEARTAGIHWTFAPMIDVTRDPRWGRIAECYGEDPYLTAELGKAAIQGFQGNDLSNKNTIAACAKHFAAYGAAEAGRDYHTVTLPENELRDVYLPPFKASVEAGASTFMTAFNEINGIPASGSEFLTRQILRKEWNYPGMVVSDWSSVQQLVVHGFVKDKKQAAIKAIKAGVDMEMASTCYEDNLKALVEAGIVDEKLIDEAVQRVLEFKFKLGLFDNPFTNPNDYPETLNPNHLNAAKNVAIESMVLLKNNNNTLPLEKNINKVAVIGPLANAPHDQMGTWVFDGDKKNSVTPLQAISDYLGEEKVNFAQGLEISRTKSHQDFAKAIQAAKKSDVVLLFIGEESILSGESHCRADISLPGAQTELINELAKTGKPIVGIVMAGRPLTFENEAQQMDAILYAWHGGSMAGPAICEVVFGEVSPSGKLPVTFPRTVGQIPIYYAQKNSGKPATDETWERMEDIPVEAPQLSVGNTNHFIDYGFKPWFPFGYGLTYTKFTYSKTQTNKNAYQLGDSIRVKATLTNTGVYKAKEVAQLYVRDLVGSRTRPVKELKGFTKVELGPGEQKDIEFTIHTNQLGFHNPEMEYVTEPGEFLLGIGGNSDIVLEHKINIQ